MADKDELEFLKFMKDRGGFASGLKTGAEEIVDTSMDRINPSMKVPQMDEDKAEKMMRQAGEAMYGKADDVSPKMSALKKIAGSGGRAVGMLAAPLLGLGTALSSGDATAAVPILGSVEGAGMSSQDEDQMIAETQGRMDYKKSQAAKDRAAALAKLSKL